MLLTVVTKLLQSNEAVLQSEFWSEKPSPYNVVTFKSDKELITNTVKGWIAFRD